MRDFLCLLFLFRFSCFISQWVVDMVSDFKYFPKYFGGVVVFFFGVVVVCGGVGWFLYKSVCIFFFVVCFCVNIF